MTVFAQTLAIETAALIALGMCGLALLLSFIRLVIGPSLPDRVVALDLVAMAVVGMIACYEIMTEQAVHLDAAMVVALLAFLGTVAFAQYVARRGRDGA